MALFSRSCGQASMEYMLVSSAFLAFLLLVLPYSSGLAESAAFAVDVLHAKSFLVSLDSAISEASVLDSGTSISVRASPAGTWRISASNGILSLSSEYGKNKSKKSLEIAIPNEIYLGQREFSSGFAVKVSKSGQGMLLEYA